MEHRAPGHPERPERLEAIERGLAADDLLSGLPRAQPEPVARELLESIHRPHYVETILRTGQRCDEESRGLYLDPDTWMGPGTLLAAMVSAGGAVGACRAVLSGTADAAFSLCRPPGHHATSDTAMGFCLFDNIALAAQAALDAGLTRVAIIDFDVHHGNGTQDIFYDRSDVLYMSCHQYPLYPGTGAAGERGDGEGTGFTVNAPMAAGAGLREYREVFDELFDPALRDYRPELLLVSAGYDAHRNDPLAGMLLSTRDYGDLTTRIRAWAHDLCEGRSVWCLEGGYDLDALAGSVAVTLHALA